MSDTPLTDAARAKYNAFNLGIVNSYYELLNGPPEKRQAIVDSAPPSGWEMARQFEKQLMEAKKSEAYWLFNAQQLQKQVNGAEPERATMVEERNELKRELEVEKARETCKECGKQWNPSLIEPGTCIFCTMAQLKRDLG